MPIATPATSTARVAPMGAAPQSTLLAARLAASTSTTRQATVGTRR